MEPIRVGLIGFGLAGRFFHAPLIEAVEGLRLAAVVTSRQAELQSSFPQATRVAHPADLWQLCDLVVIAAPNRAHAPLAEEALARGLAVVVDKPLAVSSAEGERLARRAAHHGGRLTVFHNRRWDGDFLTIRRLLAGGALGPPARFESRYERWRPEPSGTWRERADPAEGGGLLLDLGSHLIDQALVLFGPATSVYAEVDTRRPGAAVEDDVFVALQHAGSVRSHLWMSSVQPLERPRFAVGGLEGAFESFGLDPQEHQLRAGTLPGSPGFGAATRPARLATGDGVRDVELERGDYLAFYAAVVDWLRGSRGPPVATQDAVETLRVIDAARASAASRSTIPLA